MMTTKKRLISLALVATMGLQSTASAANSVLENALYNYTPSSSVTATDSNGNTIKSMYQTGSFYFRFNNNATPEPLWNFSPPSIEAGCNGLNIKGMFVSLLGLDQFGSMLQNAGTTLAWGVAVGLIYSLPGVAAVFKMINTWAKQIQSLLAQACNSGIAIGQAIGAQIGEGYKDSEIDKTISGILPSDETMTAMQNGLSGKMKVMGLDGLTASWDSGFSFDGSSELTDAAKKDVLVAPLQQMFGDVSVGGSIYMDYLLHNTDNPSLEIIKDHITGVTGNDVFTRRMVITSGWTGYPAIYNNVFYEDTDRMKTEYALQDDKDAIDLRVLSYVLYYNFVGDIGFTDDVANNLASLAKTFACSDIVAPASGTAQPAKSPSVKSTTSTDSSGTKSTTQGTAKETVTVPTTTSECQQLLADGVFNPKNPLTPSPVGVSRTEVGAAEYLTSFIVDGSEGEAKEGARNGELLAPEFLIIATKEKNVTTSSFTIVPSNPTMDMPFFDTGESFGGAKIVSQCSLYKELKEVIPENYIYQLQYDANGNSLNCDNYPKLLYGDMKLYADILYKAKDSEIIEGVNRMVLANEYYLVESILRTMASIMYVTKQNQIKVTNNTALEQGKAQYIAAAGVHQMSQTQMAKFSSVLAKTKVALDAKYSTDAKDRSSLNLYFRGLEKSIAERSLQRQK